MRKQLTVVAILAFSLIAGASAQDTISIVEDFSAYTPSTTLGEFLTTGDASWTPAEGWVANFDSTTGWAKYEINPDGYHGPYVWPDGTYTPDPGNPASAQVLRADYRYHQRDPNDINAGYVGAAMFKDISADITQYTSQTLTAHHRGLYKDGANFGRVVVGYGSAGSIEYRTDVGGNIMFNYGGGSTVMPQNAVTWEFGTGYSYDWFISQIEMDYDNGLVRARFGQEQGMVWNDWTAWLDMGSTADEQPDYVRIDIDGTVEISTIILDGTAPAGPVLLEGDANRDGVVSAGDYASVQSSFGNTGEPGILGDANLDGVVSAGDYASVQANFGATLPTGIVPEPMTVALLAVGGTVLFRRKK